MRFSSCHPDRVHHAKGKCKSCYNVRNAQKQAAKASKTAGLEAKKAHKEKIRNARYLRAYGITSKDVDAMRFAQKGRCAICNKSFKHLNVDHHHNTNTVRGLLCGTCNRGIGNLRECTTTLLNAVKYLLYWSTRYSKEAKP